jgi:hypothetical protein
MLASGPGLVEFSTFLKFSALSWWFSETNRTSRIENKVNFNQIVEVGLCVWGGCD